MGCQCGLASPGQQSSEQQAAKQPAASSKQQAGAGGPGWAMAVAWSRRGASSEETHLPIQLQLESDCQDTRFDSSHPAQHAGRLGP